MEIQNQETISLFMKNSLLEKDTTGKVHSVFKNSFNIIVQGQLFNFSSKGMPLSAYGCLLEKNKILHLLSACRIGDVVRINKKKISFYTKREIIKINLFSLHPVNLAIPEIKIPLHQITESVFYSTLKTIEFEEKLGIDFSDEVEKAFTLLKNPSQYDESDIDHTVRVLMGRGKGLTPSGDDILMGYLAVEKAFGRDSSIEKKIRKKSLNQITTEISEAYYEALFSDSISRLFVDLFLSFHISDERKILALFHKIDRYGHTSGNDTLFGVYLGLQSLINEREKVQWKNKDISSP